MTVTTHDWRQGAGRDRNVKPWPGYRSGLVSVAPWRLTVGNESTDFGFNANVGAIAPANWFGTPLIEVTAGATNTLVLKFEGGAEVVAQAQFKIDTDTADCPFVTDEYQGTDATMNGLIEAGDGTTIDLELNAIDAP